METEYERLSKRIAKVDEMIDQEISRNPCDESKVQMWRLEREEAKREREEAKREREEAKRERDLEAAKRNLEEELVNPQRDDSQVDHLRKIIQMLTLAERSVLPPPEQCSAPSKASEKDIDGRVSKVSVIERRMFVEICELMHGSAEVLGGDLMRLIRLCFGLGDDGKPLSGTTQSGLFRTEYSVPKKEQFVTAIITSELMKLKPILGSRRARWMHQLLDRAGGELDIALYAEHNASLWSPVMVFEFGLRCDSKAKANQMLAYCINMSSQLRTEEVLLAAEVVLWPTDHPDCVGWVRLSGTRLMEGRKIGAVMLWEGPLNEKTAGRLLEAAEICATANEKQDSAWSRCKNASISDGRVWKVFDYRGRNVPSTERRSSEWSLRYMLGCRAHCFTSDLCIISYPYIVGSHRPSVAKHFVSLIKCLQALHKDGIVHGDVRASNVVFGENGIASLIDFDFAGRATERTYPLGFVLKIDDGARHREASSGRVLEFAHDVFAVGAMMRLCTCEATQWQLAQRILLDVNSDVAAALKLLEEIANEALVVTKNVSENVGTGSPERKV